mmetsp:Transcript_24298/g.36016  ORF Transcript_24298/g.36016 Transcript_24298/m.36016 type:complete len:262 (+) Transcript_24298:181-966(+)
MILISIWIIRMRVVSWISVMMRHSCGCSIIHFMLLHIMLWGCGSWWWWSGRFFSSFLCHVLLHLIVEADFIFSSLILVFLFLFWCQSSPAFPHNSSQFYKFNARNFLHDLRPHIKSEKHKRSTGALRSSRIFNLLHLAMWNTIVFNQISLSVMAMRRDIRSHLLIETCLVLRSTGVPRSFFLRSQTFVHGGCVLRELAKSHARIFPSKLIAHRVLVKKIGRHVAFWCIRVAFSLSASCCLSSKSHDSISLRIKPRRWGVAS